VWVRTGGVWRRAWQRSDPMTVIARADTTRADADAAITSGEILLFARTAGREQGATSTRLPYGKTFSFLRDPVVAALGERTRVTAASVLVGPTINSVWMGVWRLQFACAGTTRTYVTPRPNIRNPTGGIERFAPPSFSGAVAVAPVQAWLRGESATDLASLTVQSVTEYLVGSWEQQYAFVSLVRPDLARVNNRDIMPVQLSITADYP